MSRLFTDWYLDLSVEERCAYDNAQSEQSEAGREEWDAERAAEERARLEREPELPFPPLSGRPAVDDDCPF